MYWKLILFLYLAANVTLVSVLSAKMKDVPNIDNIKYWNSILLVISIELLTAFTTYYATVGGLAPGSTIQTAGESKVHTYSGVLLIIFAIAMVTVTSMMIGSSDYAACPQDIKNWIIATLTVNIVLIVLAIAYMVYDRRMTVSQWFQSIKARLPSAA